MTTLLIILTAFATMAGIAALIAALVNIFKFFGLVPDGQAGRWSAALNLIALAVVISLKIFMPDLQLELIDKYAADIAVAMLIVLGYVTQLKVSSGTNDIMAKLKLPLIGTKNEPGPLG